MPITSGVAKLGGKGRMRRGRGGDAELDHHIAAADQLTGRIAGGHAEAANPGKLAEIAADNGAARRRRAA